MTYERVVIEYEDNCRVFDGDHANGFRDHGGFEPGAHVDADLIAPVSDVEEDKGGWKGSAEYWPLPGTDCLGKVCALARGPRRA